MSNCELFLVLSLLCGIGFSRGESAACEVRARTDKGWVCGTQREAEGGAQYASFRGVPYAKQPLGELRFKELQPADPWDEDFNATTEGPICPFHDVFYGVLLKPQGVSESCIHANIHVPIKSLPDPDQETDEKTTGLPILVYIHGGGWICGSGDADFNGPEYLVSKDVVVITFNYRLDVFGFLTLNTTKVPGNNGLRDMITLLRWVQTNARYFGGNPDDVTLAGQSGGSSSAHILSLSPAATGLFKRAWLMSGTGTPGYYTPTQGYAQQVTTAFLTILGLNNTDYDQVHDQLVQLPLETINNASGELLNQMGITSFVPVIESPLPNVTAILPDDPEKLMAAGNGNNITLIIGFTSSECETSRRRLEQVDILTRYSQNPLVVLSPHLLFTLPTNVTTELAQKVSSRYFGTANATMDKFIKICTDTYFAYPAIKLARARAASGGAPVYLYKFSYEAEYSVFKLSSNLTYQGAGHAEDLNNLFKVNSFPVPDSTTDDSMKDWMTDLMINFIKYSDPSGSRTSRTTKWPAMGADALQYQDIKTHQFSQSALSADDQSMVEFFDTFTNV